MSLTKHLNSISLGSLYSHLCYFERRNNCSPGRVKTQISHYFIRVIIMKASISFTSLLLAYAATSSIVHAQDTYAYKLAIDDSLINVSSDLIHWNTGQSTGTVKFCARVETFMDGLDNTEIATGSQDFKINIPFNNTDDIFDASAEVEVITVTDGVIDEDQTFHKPDVSMIVMLISKCK